MAQNNVVDLIHSKSEGHNPKVGIILGTGLGPFAENIKNKTIFSYDDLYGFPDAGVKGHAGQLILGEINGTEVAVLQGRAHYYETGNPDVMRIPIETLKDLGCETLLLTNAAGSLLPEAQPGSIMMLTDHINFTGVNPLFGETETSRFVDMANAYHPTLCEKFRTVADSKNITLHEGVYIWFSGPSFETPAEIRAAKLLGADAVGMSTVPEVILARFYGLKVAAISIITNMAAGMSDEHLTHAHSIENAKKATNDIQTLLSEFLLNYK
ncbi:MAG: purine-nucleoside phosphorylase [Candidatus Marinimicrobia bacterium]|jgi:purine-nucleoside phosphorylase|nr:purine-nucleoside phosphorylase [Candidatus Neomarinimicrobiota bacterium]MBT3840038.1 purine-nucleoside phosphorylase [Candidatus Neomarinimicrobiota bacterium]MBT4000070.1 purine-nucleoside phosphorylase [Candidatus Neomarinimicrobiota bacterium]MBT4282131.1 purine-nucleoside phosphorylase [Candidatus Neomarinimicrobiota bacterium]MBT4578870.1 purine-nucleoside phosphorylase [Candidatus Neomarinimicrobiota bacterium]